MVTLKATQPKGEAPPNEAAVRTWSLSDGVYAIAITLLSLELRVPDVPADQLPRAVLDMLPRFGTFMTSFAVIGLAWMVHRRIFRHVVGEDRLLNWLNLLHLLLVSFLPFPSDMLGRYANSPFAVISYACCLAAIYGALLGIWLYATGRRRLVHPGLTQQQIRNQSLHLLNPIAVFLLSIPAAIWSPAAAMYAWWLIALNAFLLGRRHGPLF